MDQIWLSGRWTLGGRGCDHGDSAELGKHPRKGLMVKFSSFSKTVAET